MFENFDQAIICFCHWKAHAELYGNLRMRRHLRRKFQCGKIRNTGQIWRTTQYVCPFDWQWMCDNIYVFHVDTRSLKEISEWERYMYKMAVNHSSPNVTKWPMPGSRLTVCQGSPLLQIMLS